MYSLPLPSCSDLWHIAKTRGRNFGGSILLVGSTLITFPASMEAEQMKPTSTVDLSTDSEMKSPRLNMEKENSGALQPLIPGQARNAFTDYHMEDVQIPARTEFIESSELPPGTSNLKEQGKIGVERKIIRTVKVNGKANDEIINKFILSEPEKRVVIQNTKPAPVISRSTRRDFGQREVKMVMTVVATAYTYTGNKTATGVYPHEGLIAVDPRIIPLGTKVYVEGYGYAIAADTGGAIKGNKIDVFYPSQRKCLDWGRQKVTIHILNGN